MNLSFLILIPLLTLIGIMLVNGKTARVVAFVGSLLQLGLAIFLLFAYMHERGAGNVSSVLFEETHPWFSQWNINYHIGVDGISIAMIGIPASINLEATVAALSSSVWNSITKSTPSRTNISALRIATVEL